MAIKQIELLRQSFREGITRDIKFRKEQLKNIFSLLQDEEESLVKALHADLAKPKHEAIISELGVARGSVSHLISNLDSFLVKEKVSKTITVLLDSPYIQRQPFGVVLIISPWNFPVSLLIEPLIGAIAAGNVVLLKPSELASNVEKLMVDLIPKYVDHRVCQVFCGGAKETEELLKSRFDFICFTGSVPVGRIVYQAAARHLTPVLLELGGKSPVYVDDSCNLSVAATRIAWAKALNCGQICIAPDYVLLHKKVSVDNFVREVQKAWKQFFGEEVKESKDYGRIISDKHFNRLKSLLNQSKGTIVHGGRDDSSDRFFEPTIVTDISSDDSLLTDELFGPILPIVTVENQNEAIIFITEREKPLSLYVFANDAKVCKEFEERTSSGAIVYNGLLKHAGVPNLPFGGVGKSGVGNYHGKYSIEVFSHKRACLDCSLNETVNKVVYPPYTESKAYWISWIYPTKLCKSSGNQKCTIL